MALIKTGDMVEALTGPGSWIHTVESYAKTLGGESGSTLRLEIAKASSSGARLVSCIETQQTPSAAASG